jgi:hypothetical protein
VSITRASRDTVQVSGRKLPADHFVIRPVVPGVVRWLGLTRRITRFPTSAMKRLPSEAIARRCGEFK